MTNKDNYQKVGVEVDQQSFAQLTQKANEAATAMSRLTQANQTIATSATQAGHNLQSVFQSVKFDIDKDTASLQSLRAQLKGAADDTDNLNNKASGGSFGVEGLRRTGGALTQLGLGDIGQPIQKLGDFGQVIKEVGVASEATGVALGPIAVALAGIGVIFAVMQKTIDDASKPLADAVTQLDAYYKAIETGTTESLQTELKALQVHLAIEQQKQKDLQAAYDVAHPAPKVTDNETADAGAAFSAIVSDLSSGGKQLNKDLEDTKSEVSKTQQQINALTEALKSGQVAANDTKIELENLGKGLSNLATAGQTIFQRFEKIAAQAAKKELDDLNKAVEDAQKKRDEVAAKEVASVDKYNAAVQAANDTADQARLNAAQKLNDALVNAAQAAVDAASKALETLQQKQADNLTSLDRDLSKLDREANDKQISDQIVAQRQERDDLQAHLDALKQIRDRDKSRERDDLLNRNYRDLFALKEQQNTDITNENDKYAKQEAQRKQAFTQQEQDQNRALEIQRRERLIAYQQANSDALKAYNIELQHAQEAKTRAIQLAEQANRKELDQIYKNQVNKLDALEKGEKAELKIITQTEQAKQAIFQQSLDQARAMLGQSTGAGTGPYNTPQNIARDTGFAYGGDPNYQRVKVNDGGRRESFNGVMLPRGLGLFIPMTSGRIDAGRGGGDGITINMPINGVTDPVAVGRIAREQVRAGIQEALGK